ELYGAFRAGRTPVLPELPLQYGDYAAWQREWLAGPGSEREVAWWRERLAGAPEVLELPTDRPRPPARSYRGGRREVRLPPALADRLRTLARERGATLFMVLLAGFSALLSRLTGSEDVPVGTPVAGRSGPRFEGLIGLFVNTLVLRADLSGDPAFGDLVARARETALDAWAHQDLPFEKVVEELAPERALSHSPLFQVMLILQNAPGGPRDLAGLVAEPWTPELPAARLDLTLALAEAEGGLRGEIEYDRDLFDPSTAARLAGALRTLLEDAVRGPARRFSELGLLGPAERHQLLVEWNDTAPAAPASVPAPAALLHARVEARAAASPDAVALVAGDARWSYGALLRRADALARRLLAAGLRPEERVGVCLERSPDMVVALLAVLRAGGAYVALDPGYPERRLALILEDAGAGPGRPPRVLTRERFLDRLPPATRGGAVLLETLDWRARAASAEPPERAAPENLAYLLYTSGSTGRPKGVAVEHRSAAALLDWALRAFAPEELAGALAATSINFDLSVFELFVPLAAGGTVILAEDALALPGLPAAAAVTLVNTVPSAMTELVRMGALPPSVRTVNLAGEPLKRSLAEGVHGAARVERLFNLYGPSEDTTYSTWARVGAGDPGEPTIGRPVTGTRAHVLDPRLRPVPVGAVGELCLAGAGLARGYLGRPGQTAERFVPDPLAPAGSGGGRLYRTGDLVRRLPDGALRFLGRMDHQVKLRGFRIELGEVESALLARPEVREAVAVVRRDAGAGGAGEPRLVAYAVAEAGLALEPEALRRALGEALPGYMVPAAVVVLDELPLTPNRKVDRAALPAPEGGALPAAGAAPPRDALEELLAGIWAEVLGRPRVGIRDGFFDLGGHSLLATRVVARVRQALGVEVPLRRIFERPTVEGLAEALRAAAPGADEGARPRLEPVAREGPLPASYAQERLWFLDRLDPGTSAYDVPAVFRLRGSLRPPLLARALREVVRRHEALRTVFDEVDGRPVQRVLPPPPEGPPAVLPVIDLSGLPARRAEDEAARVAGRSARLAFDLAAGPVYAAWLLRLPGAEHRLAWCAHHVAFDGWSLGVLVSELTALYGAFRRGRPSPLPELPSLSIQSADFAAWQRRALGPAALAEQVAWWRERLEGAPRALELPTDRPRPRVQSHRGGRVGTTVEPELLGRLRGLAAGEGSTLFMLLLAALGTVLSRWSGQRDLLMGSPVAGRARSEVEGLIGMFLNTLVLRLDLSGGPTFRELLQRSRETALGAYAHQDVQFEMLLEELEVERDLSRSPLFQVFLNVLNFPRAPVALPDLEVDLLDTVEGVESKFDLTLYAAERADGLALELVYAADLFDRPRMAALLEQLRDLLARAAEDPDRPAWQYPLRTGADLPQPAPRLPDRWE
ncbi:MAG TPA: amino acid adenylation domain-containing protein, partial [Thermoanaerobaculia bacterium]|nr:amino acid adenylation domain-containing protein [Thermoanaerobaculia bacterium]